MEQSSEQSSEQKTASPCATATTAMGPEPTADTLDTEFRFKELMNINVTLVVGPEAVRFGVCSAVMQRASPVFRAMFGPHWKEGQIIASGLPLEVVLDEDDAEAFDLICLDLHLRSFWHELPIPMAWLPNKVSTRLMKNMALIIDKYALGEAMRLACRHWFNRNFNGGRKFLLARTILAYHCKDMFEFNAQTSHLIAHGSGPYSTICDAYQAAHLVPRNLACRFFLL